MRDFQALSIKTPGRYESPAPSRKEALSFRFLGAYYPTTSLPGLSRALLPSESGEVFKKMIESGMDLTNETFAKVLGVSVKTIVRWRRRLGIEPKTRKLSEEDKRKIVALYKEGYTQQEIAEMFGVNERAVREVIKNHKHRNSNPEERTNVHSSGVKDAELLKGVRYETNSSETSGMFDEEEVIEEEGDDIEELEREIEEELERESRRIIASSMSKTEWRFLA